ncbi:hypothetical protein ACIQVR_21665 [Streptomyces xanthochromogenes]|uniref:hypothetical protein n=1 Tax=Streptomyces xanthochromogenes TaxID=67384 RepID=UPI0038160B8A
MRINDRDPINHTEAARILGITAVAALKGGRFSARQQRRIDRIVEQAREREDALRKNQK